MESRNVYLSGTLWVHKYKGRLDIYNPNQPLANAFMRIKDGVPHLTYAVGAPNIFRSEVQDNLNKLKTILILGG
jgi:hypothetical protein